MGILCKSVRKCPDFHTIWIFYADGKPVSQLFSYPFLQFWSELLVECFQLVTRVGSFDVDDMLLNTLGGVIGYIVFAICNMIRRWHDAKQER